MTTNQRSRESTDHFESLIDPEKAEELKRTKTEIENNISKILKLIKNDNQTKKDGNPKRSKKEAELVGLTEDLSKQYQSLYALYDGVIGSVVSGIKNRTDTLSSPGSDSEDEVYFSSEEVDGNKRRSAEKEQQNVSSTVKEEADPKVLKAEAASVDAKEYEEQLISLMEEVDNLSQKKRNLEVEHQANEVKQLSVKKTELEDQVMKLELFKEKQDVVTNLDEKLINCEEEAKFNIEKLLAQINELQLETKTLQKQKDEMEASTQVDHMAKQLNIMQEKLNSLEAEMGKKGEQISQYMTEIENLENNLAEMRSTEKTMKEEREGILARIKELELELEIQNNNKNEVEEQLRDSNYEYKQLMNENKALQDRNNELKAAMTERGEEISDFLKQNESNKNGASMETMSLKAEINAMRLELDTLYEQKTKLEIQKERIQKEYSESIAKMESLNTKLAAQISDQEKTIKDHVATIGRINVEQKQTLIAWDKFRVNQRWAERKMEELAEVFRKKMEDNIRLLHQRIHVAEQLNNENKNICRLTKIRYEQENKTLGEKVASHEEELRRLKEPSLQVVMDLKEAVMNGLDLAAEKSEGQRECILKSVSKLLCEVEFAKDWVKKRKEEMQKMKELVSEKEERELLLRDKVWNLEAEVSKGGGENLNLRKAVTKLEKKVGKLEKNVKEKDEELISLGEKKREAIRQLCIVVDFHRERCNYLRRLVPYPKVNNKRTT